MTARRKGELLIDVPETVDVVTAETVQKLNILNFQDMQSIVPGLTMNADPGGLNDTVHLGGKTELSAGARWIDYGYATYSSYTLREPRLLQREFQRRPAGHGADADWRESTLRLRLSMNVYPGRRRCASRTLACAGSPVS